MVLIRNRSLGKRMVRRMSIFILVFLAVLVAAWQVSVRWHDQRAIVLLVVAFLSLSLIGEASGLLLNWFFGNRGEEGIIKKLQTLSDEYIVITNWQPPNEKRGDVDLIVLGPQGVTALECKRYSTQFGCEGDFWYLKMDNGYKKRTKSLSKQTRGHMQSIKRHLKRTGIRSEVSGALVFHSLTRASIENPAITVLDESAIAEFISRLPRTCDLAVTELADAFSSAGSHYLNKTSVKANAKKPTEM